MRRSIHAIAWMLLAVSAVVLWPERWGGSMTYVITNGNSMSPTWHAGDLAILRTDGDYGVGDVAAYDSTDIKSIVMHRIVKETRAGYTFKGDNNDHLDPELVTPERMLGKLVVRVPGVGRYLTWFLKPINLLIVAGALFLLFGDRPRAVSSGGDPGRRTIGRVRLHSLHLPPGAATAAVADERDLERLAEHFDRPILEVEGDERRYLVDGAVVYTWAKAVQPANERRRTPQGRDWVYDGRHLRAVPDPGGSEQRVS